MSNSETKTKRAVNNNNDDHDDDDDCLMKMFGERFIGFGNFR